MHNGCQPINSNFRRNYSLKLSKAIGISISTAGIEISISNRNRFFDLFRWKELRNFDIDIEMWYLIGRLMSESKLGFLNNFFKIVFYSSRDASHAEICLMIHSHISWPRPFRRLLGEPDSNPNKNSNKNLNRNSYVEIESKIEILITKSKFRQNYDEISSEFRFSRK
jgi:hypothetical protein